MGSTKLPEDHPLVLTHLTSLVGAAILTFAAAAEPTAKPLSHTVFFTLAEDSTEHREQLISACEKYLSGHEGTLYFSVGPIAEELQREVNDRDFDVALHLVFDSKAAQDRYPEHPRHLEFIERHGDPWSTVRVFDSYVRRTRSDTPDD